MKNFFKLIKTILTDRSDVMTLLNAYSSVKNKKKFVGDVASFASKYDSAYTKKEIDSYLVNELFPLWEMAEIYQPAYISHWVTFNTGELRDHIKSGIHGAKDWLAYLADVSSSVVDGRKFDLSADYTLDNFSVSESHFQIKKIGFSSLYIKNKPNNQKLFKELYDFEYKRGEKKIIYMKSPTLLMIAAFYGYDDMIELLIKKGCDIGAREVTSQKTALDFYNPMKGTPDNKIEYIRSLLSPSVENSINRSMMNSEITERYNKILTAVEKVPELMYLKDTVLPELKVSFESLTPTAEVVAEMEKNLSAIEARLQPESTKKRSFEEVSRYLQHKL